MAWLILLCCAAALCACSKEKAAEESLDLRFHNGKFRIAQLTDIHWGDETSDTVLNAMLIETERNYRYEGLGPDWGKISDQLKVVSDQLKATEKE